MAMITAQNSANNRFDNGMRDSGDARLIEAWRHEFLHVAMMSAFVTMRCNALGPNSGGDALELVESNVPEEPAVYRAIRQGLLDVQPMYSAALFAAQTAYEALTNAIGVLKSVRAQSSGRLSAVVPGVSNARLAEAWRAASNAFLCAVEVFERTGLLPDVARADRSVKVQCPRRLMQLLRAAGAGETLEQSGLAPKSSALLPADTLPDWAQRRRWDRLHFNMKCSVAAKGSSCPATIRNISLGGALLDGAPTLARGSRIVISTGTGRRLAASVMWSRDSMLGVKFDDQLLHNDPLIETAGG